MERPLPFTLDQLSVFIEVAQQGSFTNAARSMQRAQSAISAAVGNLEGQCGVALFDRTTRIPSLTASGRQLLVEAQRVVSQARELAATAASLSAGAETELRLCVDAILPTAVLVSALRDFAHRFPRVALSLQVEELGAVAAQVAAQRADWGVSGPFSDFVDGLATIAVGRVRLLPAVSCEHPLAHLPGSIPTSVLRRHTQIVLSDSSNVSQGVEVAVLADRTHRVHDSATKRELILAGLGWGNLPEHVLRADIAAARLVQIHPQAWNEDEFVLPLRVVHRQDRPLGSSATWLVERIARGCNQT